MLGKIQMFILWKILRIVKILFLKKVMAVFVDKGQAVHDVNVADLTEVLNSDFFWGFARLEKEVECLNNSREKSENKKRHTFNC
jgi:hypothetical protein